MDLADVEKVATLLRGKKRLFFDQPSFVYSTDPLEVKLKIKFVDQSDIIVTTDFGRVIFKKNGKENFFYLDKVAYSELSKLLEQDKYKFPKESSSELSKKGSVFLFKNPEILDQINTKNTVPTNDVGL